VELQNYINLVLKNDQQQQIQFPQSGSHLRQVQHLNNILQSDGQTGAEDSSDEEEEEEEDDDDLDDDLDLDKDEEKEEEEDVGQDEVSILICPMFSFPVHSYKQECITLYFILEGTT